MLVKQTNYHIILHFNLHQQLA